MPHLFETAPSLPAETFDRLIHLRRALHRYPELAWQEQRTAVTIAASLRELGLEPRPIAETGLVVDLPGEVEGPIIALRADTDALPIHEQTGLPFASSRPGIMHACGHDGHSAMLVGAAALLCTRRRRLPVRLFWQPAEELGGGAEALIAEGVLDGVGLVFGGHIDPAFPTGELIVTDGTVNASTDTLRVVVKGQRAHAARPHQGVDAILAAAAIVTAAQSIVARELGPGEPAVLTFGTFHAGDAANVLAGEAVLEGTARAYSPAVRARLHAALARLAAGVAAAHGASAVVEVLSATPAVINAPGPTAIARRAAIAVVGAERVKPLPGPNMGGEDFAAYLERVPGAFIRFGAARPGAAFSPAHSSHFDFDEGAIAIGAAWLAAVATQDLGPG